MKRRLIELLAGLLALCISSDMTYWQCRIQIERLRCHPVGRGSNFQQKYKAVFGLLEFMSLMTACYANMLHSCCSNPSA